jgi:hypothetical protein
MIGKKIAFFFAFIFFWFIFLLGARGSVVG